MKASQIDRGKLAREPVEFDLLDGSKCAAAFRPIDATLEAEVLKHAQSFSTAQGLKDPRPGHPIYELGYEVASLLVGMVDADLPDKAEPFWDGGAAQLQNALDRDRIAVLYEKHCFFQDRISPRRHTLDRDQYIAKVFEIASAGVEDDSPFASLRPGLLKALARTMAGQLVNFWTFKSPDGSTGETAGS